MVCWRGLCLTVAVRSLGFLTVQSVKAVFLREAGTAGTSAPTTCGANISCVGRIDVLPSGTKPIRMHVVKFVEEGD